MPKQSINNFFEAESAEEYFFSCGYKHICGVDEAGRGPLAGQVVAAAVIVPESVNLPHVKDSKRLSPKAREELFEEITRTTYTGIGEASPEEIDEINILQASLLAMRRAVDALPLSPDIILVDGLYRLDGKIPSRAIVKGDARVKVISAASIIAKVTRDRKMIAYEKEFPGYGFERHKGYPTREHKLALKKLGPTPIHRQTFRGVHQEDR